MKTDTVTSNISTCRGVRQGDVISPKLFISALEDVFCKLDWSNRGVNVEEARLSHLRFADDIVIFSSDPKELQEMINELNSLSQQIGLKMNKMHTVSPEIAAISDY